MTAAEDGQVLADWWRDHAQTEINRTVPKAVEYGAGDLREIGRAMGRIMGREKLNEQEATEIGIFFYVYGKVARWEQAIHEGRQVGEDTLFDIGVYAKMASRTRQVGGWPWGTRETEIETDTRPQAEMDAWNALCPAVTLRSITGREMGGQLEVRCQRERGHPGSHTNAYQSYTWSTDGTEPREGF